jgi:hypothetical protein
MKPLQDFYSFPTFASREDYETKTGKTAPPWDRNRPLKHWADENPTNTEFDELAGEVATYRPVLSMLPNGRYREGADGQPTVGSMRLSVEVAKSYNFLPPKGVVPIAGEFLEETLVTGNHIANAQRIIQPPLNLPEGSRVVYAPGLGLNAAVLLKGESLPGATSGCNCDPAKIAKAVVAELALLGFPKPQ